MTRDAFICDAVRTPDRPLRRRARARPRRRPRRHADPGAGRAPSRRRLGARRRRDPRLRQPGRRGQPQRRPHGAAARRAAGRRSPGTTVNRLCGSGTRRGRHGGARDPGGRGRPGHRRRRREHVARALRHGQGRRSAFPRTAEIYDTTIGWRFVNPLMKAQYGIDSMPETAENVAEEFQVEPRRPGRVRAAQPAARRPAQAERALRASEIVAGRRSRGGRATRSVDRGRASAPDTTLEALARLQADRPRRTAP